MVSTVPLLVEGTSNVEEEPTHTSSAARHVAARIQRRFTSIQISWSNVFFLSGSILYVWIAMWNLTKPGVDLYDDNMNDSLLVRLNWSWYDILTIAAPFLYILNAVFEFRSAFLGRLHWELAVATIFGMAALMDMVGTLFSDSGSIRLDSVPSIMAVHFYFLQALLAFCGSSFRYENQVARVLQRGGYLLFLIGSSIDVFVSYMDARLWNIAAWDMVSSSLWMVDAFFFTLADILDD
jgi:hypothetical protein